MKRDSCCIACGLALLMAYCLACGPVPKGAQEDYVRLSAWPIGAWQNGKEVQFVAVLRNHGQRPISVSVLQREGWLSYSSNGYPGMRLGGTCASRFGCTSTMKPLTYVLAGNQEVRFTCSIDELPATYPHAIKFDVKLRATIGSAQRSLEAHFNVVVQ